MNPTDITLLLGIDAEHAREAQQTWPSWVRMKPELLQMPMVVFYDQDELLAPKELFSPHPNVRFVPWRMSQAHTQREEMLTGFVMLPSRCIDTPWYLKIDTDVQATEEKHWLLDEWFSPDPHGKLPAFIASPWSYTKPRYALDVLDDWGDRLPELSKYPRLNYPYSSGDTCVRGSRMISWLMFGRTDWTSQVARFVAPLGRLPVSSQDTYLFYCAKRMNTFYRTARMSDHGWRHCRIAAPRHRATIEPPVMTTEASTPAFTRGVIYFNSGKACLVRLLVAAASLRDFYSGPATILAVRDKGFAICQTIAEAFQMDIREWDPGIPPGPNSALLAKTRYYLGSPYDVTIALDSDTLVRGPIDELFEIASLDSFSVGQMSGWTTLQGKIARRISNWSDLMPTDVAETLRDRIAVNCGIVAFRRDAGIFSEWYQAALRARDRFIPDEVSCQLLLHRYPHRIFPAKFNCSCKYADPYTAGVHIVHYHGKKHCRPGLPFGGKLWMKRFRKLVDANCCGVRKWALQEDRWVARYFKHAAKRKKRPPSKP